MTAYRLCLLGPNGKIAAVQWLHADTDEEALSIAKETVKGSTNVSGYEVWNGARRVEDGRKVSAEARKDTGRGKTS